MTLDVNEFHPPLSAPRAARRLSPDPSLRLPRQRSSARQTCQHPHLAGRARASRRREPRRLSRALRPAYRSIARYLFLLRRPHDRNRHARPIARTGSILPVRQLMTASPYHDIGPTSLLPPYSVELERLLQSMLRTTPSAATPSANRYLAAGSSATVLCTCRHHRIPRGSMPHRSSAPGIVAAASSSNTHSRR
jgi:hypothetical protein